MRIQESQVELKSTHEAKRTQTLDIESEIGFRKLFNKMAVDTEEDQAAELKRIQQLLSSLLDAILAALDGKKCREKFAVGEEIPSQAGQKSTEGGPVFSWQQKTTETINESEKTTVCGNGKVCTADGREINFNYAVAMAREFSSQRTSEESGTIKLRDPLMLSFTGRACELTQECIKFDLDADGKLEEIPGLGAGTGFLVFDRNGNGRADDGSELFGVSSGNGFADLAGFDSDNNGWIDESDPIFNQLAIWSNEGFNTLSQRGIGALMTATVDAPFSLKTKDNELLGEIRLAGLYLSEAGEVGQMQQVDLVVSDLPSGTEHPAKGDKLAA